VVHGVLPAGDPLEQQLGGGSAHVGTELVDGRERDLRMARQVDVVVPGDQNATIQLTLFNVNSQFTSSYNLLFANILLITIPPLIMYIFFNRQIVAGMTAGAVKG
jgi:hypothetical protein